MDLKYPPLPLIKMHLGLSLNYSFSFVHLHLSFLIMCPNTPSTTKLKSRDPPFPIMLVPRMRPYKIAILKILLNLLEPFWTFMVIYGSSWTCWTFTEPPETFWSFLIFLNPFEPSWTFLNAGKNFFEFPKVSWTFLLLLILLVPSGMY